jgi:hypothetical protein
VLVHLCVGQLSSQSTSWSLGRYMSVGRLVTSRLVGQLVGRPVGWYVGRSVRRSVGRSVRRSVGRSVGELVGEFVCRSVGLSVSWSVLNLYCLQFLKSSYSQKSINDKIKIMKSYQLLPN